MRSGGNKAKKTSVASGGQKSAKKGMKTKRRVDRLEEISNWEDYRKIKRSSEQFTKALTKMRLVQFVSKNNADKLNDTRKVKVCLQSDKTEASVFG